MNFFQKVACLRDTSLLNLFCCTKHFFVGWIWVWICWICLKRFAQVFLDLDLFKRICPKRFGFGFAQKDLPKFFRIWICLKGFAQKDLDLDLPKKICPKTLLDLPQVRFAPKDLDLPQTQKRFVSWICRQIQWICKTVINLLF